MEPHENKQLALQKSISAHEQAAATLNDLMSGSETESRYRALLTRIEENIRDLQGMAGTSRPGDHV